MEVPFLSSSAINREHYNLVHGIETSSTPQQVDDILVQKVRDVRRRFEKRAPTSSECVHSLILLLYCWTATSLGQVTRAALEFALPHAITLAEAGSTLNQKRTGYLFCTEIMSKSDELQLLLVNTLRKDLYSLNTARICLALDVLLVNCPTEAVPAVAPRLIDLLAHDSSHVKRKTMAVIRGIGRYQPDILVNLSQNVSLRLQDPDTYVVGSALRLLGELTRAHIIKPPKAFDLVLGFISTDAHGNLTRKPRLPTLEMVGRVIKESSTSLIDPKITTDVVKALFTMIERATDAEQALVLECFRVLAGVSVEDLRPHFISSGSKTWSILGRLLNSTKPNTQYLCIACLAKIDPIFWAGIAGDMPPAFDEDQVHNIMGLLDSPDHIIRNQTLQVLSRVDRKILSMRLNQLLSAFPSAASDNRSRLAERVLEVSAIYDLNGDAYAHRLRDVCIQVSHHDVTKGKQKAKDSGVRFVSENIVEQVLLHLRTSTDSFRRDFVDTTVRIPVSDAGPNLTLVIAASVCEHGALASIPQKDLLRGLAERLEATSPAIQEALLLTMLRVAARCQSIPDGVSEQVQTLHRNSRSHIRHRCEQYLSFSVRTSTLKEIVKYAKSDTLPDFLFALEAAESHPQTFSQSLDKPPKTSEDSNTSRSRISPGTLRYEAYEPPQPAPKFIHRRSSTASVDSHATGSSRSGSVSSLYSHFHGQHGGKPDVEPMADDDLDDGLSRTVTAGDLALAAHESGFVRSASISATATQVQGKRHKEHKPIDDLMSKTDLIALDSPFLAELPHSFVEGTESQTPLDFETAWNALMNYPTSRGWCERSTEEVVQRFQALTSYRVTASVPDVQPSQGEIWVVLSSRGHPGLTPETGLLAAIRLRHGEEASALWHMRCLDATLKAELRALVEDGQ